MPSLAATIHWPALVVPLVAVVVAAVIVRRTAPGRRAILLGGAGILLLTLALVGPLDWIAERRLLAAHMVQHIAVMSLAPSLLLAGYFAARADGREPEQDNARGAWIAAGCLTAAIVTIWLLHSPPAFDAAMRSAAGRDLHHLPLLLAGLALTWPLLDPSGLLSGFGGPIYLVLAEIGLGLLGMWLAWYPSLVYESSRGTPSMLGLSDASDQSLAGAILLVVEEPLLAAEFAVLFIRALGDGDDEDE